MQDNVLLMKKIRFVFFSINYCKYRVYKYQNIFYFYFNRFIIKVLKKIKFVLYVELGYSLYFSLFEDLI